MSEQVTDDRPLVSFLYTLLRDHMHAGQVEALVRDAEEHPEARYTNRHLARYSQELAYRLTEPKKQIVHPEAEPS